MAAAKPQGQALRVLAHSQPCPFPPATLHLQVAKAERRSASGGAQVEKAGSYFEPFICNAVPFGSLLGASRPCDLFVTRPVSIVFKTLQVICPPLHHLFTFQ